MLYSNLGDIKYAVISDPSSVNPLDLLKNKWNELELNKIYLIKINITSAYVALVQKYSSHNYGSAIIFSYTVSTERPIYVQIQAGGWAETTLITNTDLHKVTHKKNFGGFSANSMREFLIAVINKVLENNLWTSPEDVIVFCATWFGNSYGMGILASQNNNNDIIISYDSEDGNSYTMHYVPSTNTVKTLYKRQGTSLL